MLQLLQLHSPTAAVSWAIHSGRCRLGALKRPGDSACPPPTRAPHLGLSQAVRDASSPGNHLAKVAGSAGAILQDRAYSRQADGQGAMRPGDKLKAPRRHARSSSSAAGRAQPRRVVTWAGRQAPQCRQT